MTPKKQDASPQLVVDRALALISGGDGLERHGAPVVLESGAQSVARRHAASMVLSQEALAALKLLADARRGARRVTVEMRALRSNVCEVKCVDMGIKKAS